jgi:hypothetical protein
MRISLVGRLRDIKVQFLRRLEIERIREFQEILWVAYSERGSPGYWDGRENFGIFRR